MKPAHRLRRVLAVSFLLLTMGAGAYLVFVAKQIESQSAVDEARPADVIVVMGAAEYNGRPSPVLEARLNHALVLYLKGYAPWMLTTGGAGGDPVHTEGEVGRAYLTQHGVPSEAILSEEEGATTGQSLAGVAEIMREMNFTSCIVVSDGYHIYRVKRLLETHHILVFGSPRPEKTSPLTAWQRRRLYLRQAVGFALWQLGINF